MKETGRRQPQGGERQQRFERFFIGVAVEVTPEPAGCHQSSPPQWPSYGTCGGFVFRKKPSISPPTQASLVVFQLPPHQQKETVLENVLSLLGAEGSGH